ncbi:MAG: Trm112 family protein [Planctomycetia bacterium]
MQTVQISEALMEILRCPVGRQKLKQEGERLICVSCGLAFPIRDGLPVMVVGDAELPAGCHSLADLSCAEEFSPAVVKPRG